MQIARLRLVSAPSSGISVAGEAVRAVLAEERAPPRATRPGMVVGNDLLVVRSLSRVCHESFSRFFASIRRRCRWRRPMFTKQSRR